MLNIIVLFILALLLYFFLEYFWRKRLITQEKNYEKTKNQQARLIADYSRLKADNYRLKQVLDETLALYDITREICKYLEADKIFGTFNEKIRKYLELKDCQFLKSDADLTAYRDYTVLPLQLASKPLGYLVASGVNEKDRDKFNILAQQFILGVKRGILYQKVQEMATLDSLTLLFSRRYWFERCAEEMARSKKFNYHMSCLMLDIDRFKDYNDKYGHLVGDAILVSVSRTIKENIRQIDLVGKYGGEEFCLVLTETDVEAAQFVAERIRRALEEGSVRAYDEDLKVTISIGISVLTGETRDFNNLVDEADQALYRAKETGRNKVCLYSR